MFVVTEPSNFNYDNQIVFKIEANEYKGFEHYHKLLLDQPGKNEVIFMSQKPGDMMVKFIKDFTDIKAAGGLVVNELGELLLMKRNGTWDLPKGKVEEGEFLRQAASREVKEETGLPKVKISHTVKPTFHIYKLDDSLILKTTYWYYMLASSQDKLVPQKSEGIEELIWVNKKDLKKYVDLTYPNIKILLAIFASNKKDYSGLKSN